MAMMFRDWKIVELAEVIDELQRLDAKGDAVFLVNKVKNEYMVSVVIEEGSASPSTT
jgi:hypothetical protein